MLREKASAKHVKFLVKLVELTLQQAVLALRLILDLAVSRGLFLSYSACVSSMKRSAKLNPIQQPEQGAPLSRPTVAYQIIHSNET